MRACVYVCARPPTLNIFPLEQREILLYVQKNQIVIVACRESLTTHSIPYSV